MDAKKEYAFWLEDSYFDEETKEELRSIAEDENEIEERFCRNLEFGTGGLRGVIGAGTNRMLSLIHIFFKQFSFLRSIDSFHPFHKFSENPV